MPSAVFISFAASHGVIRAERVRFDSEEAEHYNQGSRHPAQAFVCAPESAAINVSTESPTGRRKNLLPKP
jgi:hypothetical protein